MHLPIIEPTSSQSNIRGAVQFDISSILRARSDLQARLTKADDIGFLETMMESITVTKNDLAGLVNDMNLHEDQYREEYETVNETLVPVKERIDFADAKTTILDLLTHALNEM